MYCGKCNSFLCGWTRHADHFEPHDNCHLCALPAAEPRHLHVCGADCPSVPAPPTEVCCTDATGRPVYCEHRAPPPAPEMDSLGPSDRCYYYQHADCPGCDCKCHKSAPEMPNQMTDDLLARAREVYESLERLNGQKLAIGGVAELAVFARQEVDAALERAAMTAHFAIAPFNSREVCRKIRALKTTAAEREAK